MARNDLTGTLFADRYRLERKLGSGGMADVWLAEDQELGRRVAVKILHERYSNDEQFVERFRREATHAAGLSHPNIVSIFDRGVADGSYYIVMEYIEGRTLKELVVTRGPCPVPVAISYTRQILAALRYAHRNGIIHRDIKPHNVLVDREGRVKVADFGIARAGASEMTEAGSIVGTAQYLSPEQARGAPVDESSDLYSTGIVLYELLTGTVPFTGETPVEIAMKHLSQTPEPPSTRRAEIPHDLDLVVLRALAKEPADRYRSAGDLDRDLELVARGEAVGSETETAATMVLSGAGAMDATAATRVAAPLAAPSTGGTYGGDERYRAYDGPVARRRSLWPWLLALAALVAVAIGGWFLYDNVQKQIDENKTVVVQQYTGILEVRAVDLIISDGFEPKVRRLPSNDQPVGIVFEQSPVEGTGLAKGGLVTILVSTGKKTVDVPGVVGQQVTDAVAALTRAGLNTKSVGVASDKPTGTVTAQDPSAGTSVVEGATVRVNYSTGPKQVAVPPVVGLDYSTALQQLQAAGFAVGRTDVESDQPAGVVVSQVPVGSSTATKGSTVTLSVSNGPADDSVARRDQPARRRSADDIDGCRLQGHRDQAGHRRGGLRRRRDLAGSSRQHTAGSQYRDHAVRRRVRAPGGDDLDRHDDDRRAVTARVRVAVLAGGRSSEHEISLASARSVVEALDPARYETRLIEIGRDGAWALPPAPGAAAISGAHETLPIPTASAPSPLGSVDVVLPILHGPFGEDGTVQGLLELAGVPYVGSGVTASALCMDKDLFKAVLRDRGIPVAASVTLRSGDPVTNPFGYPVFVKPARLGSSVGISKARTVEELEAAVELARRHDDKVLVEEFQPGMEVEVGVLGNRAPVASLVGEIVAHADWYDFEAKYAEGGMDLIVPARLPAETADEVRRLAVAAFVATDCEGMARVDFFVRPDGQVVVNELNTIPGFTATSVYAKLFAETGIPYAGLLDQLVALALERHERRGDLIY